LPTQNKKQLKELKLDHVDSFLPGVTAYLSEPKQQAFFEHPNTPLNAKSFVKKLGSKKLIPQAQTRILSLGKQVYCNGESVTKGQPREIISAWQTLSAKKSLKTTNLQNLENSSLYEAYLAGWLIFEP
jgi:50S ribosomal protein L16 3-hydroxylase